MHAVKDALAVLAGIVGLLTAFLTLYAKYLDVKKSAPRASDVVEPPLTAAARPEPAVTFAPLDEPQPARRAPVLRDPEAVERARQSVKAPATTMIAAGVISLFSNMFIAGFGYVDRFVTPLTTETRNQRAYVEAARTYGPPNTPGIAGAVDRESEDATAVMTVFTLLGLSVASVAAIWAGYEMLRLRGYWLSVAGSFAVMAGAFFCCAAGLPVGIWSLSVLYKPEVASAFR
jgi:hypothetical protein